MKNIILFDSLNRDQLLPLTFLKPICELRVGILTIREKWEKLLDTQAAFITQDYLSDKYSIQVSGDNLVINGSILPDQELLTAIDLLSYGEALISGDALIAARLDRAQFEELVHTDDVNDLMGIEYSGSLQSLDHPEDIFLKNAEQIAFDFELLTDGRKSQALSDTNTVLGTHPIFIEEGASVECTVLNASDGPIYIGKHATVMEGSFIRGSFAICEHATIKMGAKIYSGTTVGPHCKVGGEVNNTVFQAYSNKGHDGFIGNSVVGEWCNIGADTNISNLKNNYAPVKLWSYTDQRFRPTGLQFCGLILGDHSKCGINTMFNTGTVVGVSANIFGANFPRNFIPSFSWGGAAGMKTFTINKALETAEAMMNRRGVALSDLDRAIMTHVFEQDASFRTWEPSKSSVN
jgi:UDP-N-acetylglucosamine diphosphorylase/glucosamine-1-phosphate N-acetyltransferase